jgi:hypothetical protein
MQSYSSSSFAFVYLVSDAVFDADHEYGVIFLFPFGFKGKNPVHMKNDSKATNEIFIRYGQKYL